MVLWYVPLILRAYKICRLAMNDPHVPPWINPVQVILLPTSGHDSIAYQCHKSALVQIIHILVYACVCILWVRGVLLCGECDIHKDKLDIIFPVYGMQTLELHCQMLHKAAPYTAYWRIVPPHGDVSYAAPAAPPHRIFVHNYAKVCAIVAV